MEKNHNTEKMNLDKIAKNLDEDIFTIIPQNPRWDPMLISVLIALYDANESSSLFRRIDDLHKMHKQILKYPLDWELDRIPKEEME